MFYFILCSEHHLIIVLNIAPVKFGSASIQDKIKKFGGRVIHIICIKECISWFLKQVRSTAHLVS